MYRATASLQVVLLLLAGCSRVLGPPTVGEPTLPPSATQAALVPTPFQSPTSPEPSLTSTVPPGTSLPPAVPITIDNLGSLRAILDFEQRANGVAWSPDGTSIALATSEWVRLLTVPSLELQATLILKDDTVINKSFRSVAFHPDGDRVAGVGGYLQQWTLSDQSPYRQYVSAGSPITTVGFSPDGSLIAFGFDGGVFVAPSDYSSAQAILRPGESNYPVTALSFSQSAPQLASVADDGYIRIWDLVSGQQLVELGSGSGVDVAFSPNGGYVVSGGSGPLTLWDPAKGVAVWETSVPEGSFINAVAFDPTGSFLASGLSDGTVLFLDSEDGSRLHKVAVAGTPSGLEFHPDGTYLSFASAAGDVRILAIPD